MDTKRLLFVLLAALAEALPFSAQTVPTGAATEIQPRFAKPDPFEGPLHIPSYFEAPTAVEASNAGQGRDPLRYRLETSDHPARYFFQTGSGDLFTVRGRTLHLQIVPDNYVNPRGDRTSQILGSFHIFIRFQKPKH